MQFKPGMSWDNYGLGGWHIDHKKPVAAFHAQGIYDMYTINMLCNLQPLWAAENRSKSNNWTFSAANDNFIKLGRGRKRGAVTHIKGSAVTHIEWSKEDLDSWMIRIGQMRGKTRISEREAAQLLDWSRESLRQRLSGDRPVPRYIALACKMVEIMERAKS